MGSLVTCSLMPGCSRRNLAEFGLQSFFQLIRFANQPRTFQIVGSTVNDRTRSET
jgi:hypothetical protein